MNPLLKAAFWNFLANIIQKGVSFLSIPIFTRFMTTAEYGKFTVFIAWSGILSVFTTLKVTSGTVNNGLMAFENNEMDYLVGAQGLVTTLTTVFILSLLLMNEALISKIFPFDFSILLLMAIYLLMENSLGLWSGYQRFHFKYKLLFLISVVYTITSMIFSLTSVVYAIDKGTARILAFSTYAIIFCSIFYFYLCVVGRFRLFKKQIWIFILKLNLPLIPHYLSQTVLNSIDRIMIERFCGVSEAGIYGLAYSISIMSLIINESINNTFMPWTYRKIKENKLFIIRKISNYLVIAVMMINIIIILISPEIINIFAPRHYSHAKYFMPPLVGSVLLMFLYNLFGNIEFYFKKTYFTLIGSVLAATLNFILNLYFIPRFGYFIAAWTTLISYVFHMFIHYIFMRYILKTVGVTERIYDYEKIFLFTAVMILSVIIGSAIIDYLRLRYVILIIILLISIILATQIRIILQTHGQES